jgi:aconitate hydratase
VKEYDVASLDTFRCEEPSCASADASYEIFTIDKVEGHDRLPYS